MGTCSPANPPQTRSSMRSLILILVVSLAVASVQAKKAKGGKGGKPAKAEPAGLCLSKENMMMICHAGSALERRLMLLWRFVLLMLRQELRAREKARVRVKERAKEKEEKGKLPNAQQLMRLCRWLVKNMLERFVCSLSLGGWMRT